MFNLIKSEIYKLKYDKEIRLCILLITIFGVINLYFHGHATGRENLLHESMDMISLVACAVFSGISIGGEFSKRTIYHLIISGHSRFSVFVSKFVSYLLGCTFIVAINIIINGGIYSVLYGWGKPFDYIEIMFIIKYIIVNIIFILCIASAVFIVPFIVRDGAMATVVSTFIMGVFLALSQIFWSYTTLNIASGIFDVSNIYVTCAIIAIPIIIIIAGNVIFKAQDIK